MASSRIPEHARVKRFAHYATNSPLKPSRDDIFKAALKERRLERYATEFLRFRRYIRYPTMQILF